MIFTKKKKVNVFDFQVKVFDFHKPISSTSGEIILDDLSFDILEALKNVDEVKGEKEERRISSSKKRKTRNNFSYTNSTTREVVVDEDTDEEYSPPKVRTRILSKKSNSASPRNRSQPCCRRA